MECTHEIGFLIGDKDGILCRNCGRRFKDFAEIKKPDAEKPQAEQPKKAGRKKA